MALLNHGGRSFVLERTIVTLGTAADADIVVTSPHCSRKHALVVRDGDGWLVIDFRSANGVAVNGQPIELHKLRDGDVITLSGATGPQEVRFEFRDGVVAERAPRPRSRSAPNNPALALARIAQAIARHASREALLPAVLDALLDLTAADRGAIALLGPVRVEDTRNLTDGFTFARERTPGGFETVRWPIWSAGGAAVLGATPVVYSAECAADPRLDVLDGNDRRARMFPMLQSGVWASLDAMGRRYGVLQLDTRIGSKPLAPSAEDIVKAVRAPLGLALAALHARERI